MRGVAFQFNWIFVLIAGALILTFFFGVAQRQRALSEQQLSLTLAADLESIFTSAVVSRGTAQDLPVPDGLVFECSEGCDCRFRVGSASRSFGDLVVFAPSAVDRAIVWAVEWAAPFHVTNFLLVAPRKKHYLIAGQDAFSKQVQSRILDGLPAQLDVEVVSSVPDVYDAARFVFVNTLPDPPVYRGELEAVRVNRGSVSFFVKYSRDSFWTPIDTVPYGSDEQVFAALFSDALTYRCGIKQAYRKATYVGRVLEERARTLQDIASARNSSCYYDAAIAALSDHGSQAGDLARMLGPADAFSASSMRVDQVNRNVVQRSCPGLF